MQTRGGYVAVFAGVLLTGYGLGAPTQANAQTLGAVQFGAEVEAPSLSTGAVEQVQRRLAAALARAGIGRMFAESPTRFFAVASVVPLTEEAIPGTPPMVGFSTAMSVVFTDAVTGAAFAEYSTESRAVGRNREDASRNIGQSLRFSGSEWAAAVQAAQDNALHYFETRCDLVLQEADISTAAGDLESALVSLASVPHEATSCRTRANQKQLEVFAEFERRVCASDYARARARWLSDKSRQSASDVAAVLGLIPAGSACFEEASILLEEVASSVEAYDRAEAERLRERMEYERQLAEQAREDRRDRIEYEREVAAQEREDRRDVLDRVEAIELRRLEAAERVAVEWIRSRPSTAGSKGG